MMENGRKKESKMETGERCRGTVGKGIAQPWRAGSERYKEWCCGVNTHRLATTTTMASHQQYAFDSTSKLYNSPSQLDFFSFSSPQDVLAPHPDLFESELDSSLAAYDPLQLQLPFDPAFAFLRTDTPSCGPLSTLTVSSESASTYDSVSQSSQSDYYHASANGSSYTPTNYSFDFERVRLDAAENYAAAAESTGTASAMAYRAVQEHSLGHLSPIEDDDPTSFGTLPMTTSTGSVYSDYGSDYSPQPMMYNGAYMNAQQVQHHSMEQRQNTLTMTNAYGMQLQTPPASPDSSILNGMAPVRSQLPAFTADNLGANGGTSFSSLYLCSSAAQTVICLESPSAFDMGYDEPPCTDPSKKFRCQQCNRGFARRYNLKTHLATHDPNRPKPFVCLHRQCGRSFSRKHDLTRHGLSIHGKDAVPVSSADVGVALVKERQRCNTCGFSAGNNNGAKACSCTANIK